MKRWKTAVSLCLAFSLAFGQTAMAEITITPLTPEAAASLNSGEEELSQLPPGTNTGTADQTAPVQEEFAGPGPWNQPGSAATESGTQGGLSYTTETTKSQSGTAGTSTTDQPEVQAPSAVLYDVTNGRVLYEKDARSKYYPASITKLMTALLVIENTSMDDRVTYSQAATTNLEAGAVALDVTAGDVISVKDSLYGMLLKSANEVANGLAEHVAGSIGGFVDMMNQRAQALGCTGTHFNNTNGLNDTNHYTTAYDMALIAAEAFKNPTLCQIAGTVNYTFPATKKVSTPRTLTMGHKMINPSDARYYPGIVGGKTGYTSVAGNTLVTCVEQDGLRLVAVVLKSRQTHYQDTKALLDYGFALSKETNAGNGGPGGISEPGSQASGFGRWIKDEGGWKFEKASQSLASNENLMIDGVLYHFDDDSYMATGWRRMNGLWYYFTSSGAMAKNRWLEDKGSWFYIGENGNVLTDTTTPDGHYVDAAGVWVQ